MENCWRHVAVVIPALNPKAELVTYVEQLQQYGFLHIVVVDDGSDVTYQSIFSKIDGMGACKVIHHEENRGKGRAMKTAIASVLQEEEIPGVVTADADGQHLAEDVVAVAKCLVEEPEALILGVRDFSGKNPDIPWKSKLGNRITSRVFFLLFGRYLKDTQTGLRGMGRIFCQRVLELKGERYELEMNVLMDAVRHKQKIKECTIATVYEEGNPQSHFHPVKDSLRIYGLMFQNFFSFVAASLTSSVVDISLFQLFIWLLAVVDPKARIFLATLGSRACSSLLNFALNKKLVFGAKGQLWRTMAKYYLLCVAQLLLSAGCVWGIYTLTHFPESVIKIPVDVCIFFLSYQIQRCIVFKLDKRPKKAEKQS